MINPQATQSAHQLKIKTVQYIIAQHHVHSIIDLRILLRI
jgi:hypothetical protein